MSNPAHLCEAIRNSFNHSVTIFENGSCFEFFKILRPAYPQSRPYYSDKLGHVFTEIDGAYYDINGVRSEGNLGLQSMTMRQLSTAHRWKRFASITVSSVDHGEYL